MPVSTPLDVPGLFGWFEARALTGLANQAAVPAWADLSGGGRDLAQATAGSRPTYGVSGGPNGTPSVNFAPGQWLASSAFTAVPQPFNLFLVVRVLNDGSSCHLFDGGSGGRCDVFNDGTGHLQLYSGGGGYVSLLNQSTPFVPRVPARGFELIRVLVNGSASTMWRNGVPSGLTGDPGADAVNGFTLGAYFGGGNPTLSGGYAGAYAVAGAMTAGQVADLTAYINTWAFNEAKPQAVCDGDSLTFGYPLPCPPAQSYPGRLAGLLPGWDVYNTGANGRPLGAQAGNIGMVGFAPDGVDPVYRATRSANVCVYFGGMNDLLGFSWAVSSAATVLARMAAYYAARKAAGWSVGAVTLPPSNYAGTATTYEADRLAVNAALRAAAPGTYFDAGGLVDFGADALYGAAANTGTTTYDGLHFLPAGHAALAAAVEAAVLALTPPAEVDDVTAQQIIDGTVAALATAPVGSVATLAGLELAGGTVSASPAPTTTSFTATGLPASAVTGSYDGQRLIFQGSNGDAVRVILAHIKNSSNHTFTFTSGSATAFPAAPAAGDVFKIG